MNKYDIIGLIPYESRNDLIINCEKLCKIISEEIRNSLSKHFDKNFPFKSIFETLKYIDPKNQINIEKLNFDNLCFFT